LSKVRFLFATQPITGHVLPAVPIVRSLTERGHDVVWYTGRKFQATAERAGARFEPYVEAHDYDDADYDAAFPGRGALHGLNQIRFDFIHLFMRQIAPQVRDLERILSRAPADVVVGDPSVFAALAVHERGGPPGAIYGITCLGIKGRDVAPFGLGLLPNASPIGRMRNRLLGLLATNVVFRNVTLELRRQCDELSIRRRGFEGIVVSPFLFLQPSVPSFEYPRSDLPPQVQFIGALLPDPPDNASLPAWWDEVEHSQQPVVLVTQGTVATEARALIAPTLTALAREPVLVVVAGLKDPVNTGLPELPANARWAPFVPFKPLLPHVSAYVTNGGFGGVMYALANGVPIVAAGITEDKPEIGNRVAFSGVGINLKTASPQPATVRAAVRSILDEPGYRSRAQAIQRELAQHDAPAEAAALLEQLAATKQPVTRAATPTARAAAARPR
jgi:UDP:flavonoid glycosyltransferase YjiC (YdhE family)